MKNPSNAFISEAEGTFKVVLITILGFVILGTLGTALGMQAITNQMISAIFVFVLLFLAIPSTAFIIFIIWVFKKINENTEYFYAG